MRNEKLAFCTLTAILAGCGWACPAGSWAAVAPSLTTDKHDDDHGLPNFDIRNTPDGAPTTPVLAALAKHPKTSARLAAADRLRALIPNLTIDDDQFFGTPRFIQSWQQPLTAENKGVAPIAIVQNFIADYTALLEIDAAEIPAARITRNFTDDDTGITHLTFQQLVNGIDLYDAGIKANVDRNGRLINISSTMLPRPANNFVAPEPKLSDLEAIRAAAASVGIKVTIDPTPAEEVNGPSQKRRWNNSADFRADQAITTQRVLFPLTRDDIRPAWYLVIPTKGVGHTYDMVIDAIDGTVLFRANELCFDSVRAYTTRSPVPVFGGPFASRSLVPGAVNTASPFGWWDTNGAAGSEFTDSRGNNVDAHLDRNADNLADASPPRPSGGPSIIIDPTLDVALSPTSWGDASVAHGFYLVNYYHDRLYTYGFTEAAGNFQTNNYGRGGVGNDAVQLDCQDGSGTNNANFGTPADGSAGRCQMYLWTNTTPNRDSTLDADVMFHELSHGLSNRLTGGPANASALNNTQSGGMGEGWGDFIALCLESVIGDDPNGSYPVGVYSVGSSAGIRRRPYSTNLTVDPINWDAYGASGTTSYGITRSTEVHNTGEIWCVTLWDCRANMFALSGFAANDTIIRLVVEGMKLQPANPSITQARDAILAADTSLFGGANQCAIWTAFAKRGLGPTANIGASTSTTTPTLDFTPPCTFTPVVPLEPRALSAFGSPTPGTVNYPGGGSTTFNLTIIPGTLPTSTGVVATLNASAIGLGSFTIPATRTVGPLPGGNYDLPVHVTDAQGRSYDTTILYSVIDTPGACCATGGVCTVLTHQACDTATGTFVGVSTCAINPCTATPEVEPNNSTAAANDLSHRFTAYSGNLFHMGFTGGIATTTDSDYFNIGALQVGDVLTASESGADTGAGTMPDALVRVYRNNGGAPSLLISDDDSGPGLDALLWKYTITTADTYLVRASRANTANIGTYRIGLSLENTGTTPTTGGGFIAETEPNDTNVTPNNASASWRAVQYVAINSGNITAGDTDFASYQFTAGDLVSIYVYSSPNLNARVNLRNAAGTVIAFEDGTSDGPGSDSPIYAFMIPATGVYYVEVLGASGTGSYLSAVYLSTNTAPPVNCPGDFNNSGTVSVQDIFDFLAAYFAGSTSADINHSGGNSVQDIFDFLAAYFAPCP